MLLRTMRLVNQQRKAQRFNGQNRQGTKIQQIEETGQAVHFPIAGRKNSIIHQFVKPGRSGRPHIILESVEMPWEAQEADMVLPGQGR